MVEKKSWRDYSKTSKTSQSGSKKTGTWRDYSSTSKTGSNASKGSWRDYSKFNSGEIVGNQIVDRINNWMKNHNSYISEYQNRYSGRNYDYSDSYVSDSADWLTSVSQRKDSLYAEADEIISYLDQYSGYLNSDWVKEVKNTITKVKDQQYDLLYNAGKDKEYWDSFGTEELVKQYGSAEEAYKYHQRADGYSKKYTGQTYEDLAKVIDGLEDGEEKKWLTSYASSVDYDEKSKLDLSATENEIAALEAEIEELDNYFFESQDSLLDYLPGTYEHDAQVAKLYGKYGGSAEAMENYILDKRKQLDEKQKRLDSARSIQNLIAWNSVSGNADFGQNSQYVSNVEYGLFGKPTFTDDTYAYINNPTVEDKRPLGAGEATARELISWNDDIYKSDTPLRNRDSSYEREALDNISADEIAIYNYYYATQGPEKARQYLDLLVDTFQARKDAKTAENVSKFASEHPWIASALSVGTSIGSGFEYIGDVIEYGGDKLLGNDAKLDRNESALVTNAARGAVAEKVDWEIGNWDAFDFLYNTTMSGIDSLASTAFGGAGGAVLGLSAAAQGTNDALSRGMSDGQAFWNGIFSGVFEGLFESVSIGNFNALKEIAPKNVKDIFKNLGKSMLVNASEETLTEIANIGYDTLVNGEFANYTLEELANGAWKEALGQVLEAGASGALMGVGMGGIASVSGYASNKKADNAALKKYDGKTDMLIQEGLQSDVKSESYKLAQEYKQQTDGGKALTGEQIRNLLAANQDQITPKDLQKIKKAAENRLTNLGQTEDVGKIAELVTKRATGQKMSDLEKSVLARSQFGAQVAKELLPENIKVEGIDTDWTEDIGTREINYEAYNRKAIKAWHEELDRVLNGEYKSLEERVKKDKKFSVSESGQAEINGETVSLKKAEVKEFVKDKTGKITDMVIEVDGKTVKASEIDYANGDQSYLFSAVQKIENITPEDATVIVRDYDPSSGLTVGQYLNGIDEAYTYGYHGYSEADMKAGDFTTKLGDTLANSAYVLGQNAKKFGIESKETTYKRMRTAADAKMTAEQKAAQQKARIESDDVDVYFQDGKSVVKFDEHTGKYDPKRMAAVNTAKFLSKLGIGGKYYFFESYVKDNVRVYKDADGNEVEAPNGMYKDADGSIHIDLNAGDYGQGTALFTLGHELTHFVKAQSEKQFKILGDLVKEAFDKTDMSMHKRVLAKQKFLTDKRGKAVSYTEAYEEVVADAMSTMLTDGSFHEKIMEIKVKDKGLFNTIKRFFDKMIAQFRKVYEKLTPDQQDAQDIREMKDMFDRIQTAFAEALVEASDNFQASEAQKNTTQEGDVHQSRRLSENDLKSYLRAGTRRNKNKLEALERGQKIILTSETEIVNYINDAIERKPDAVTVAYGKVNDRLADDVRQKTKGKIVIDDNYLELVPESLQHAYEQHSKAKEMGDIDLSPEDFKRIPEYLDSYTELLYAIRYNSGQVRICVSKKLENGRILIIETVSKSRGSIQFKNAIGVSEEKYTQEYLPMYKKEAVTPTRGNDSSNNSLRDSYDSENNIHNGSEIVKNKSAEEVGLELDEKTESVSPKVMSSERTWTESDYVQQRDKAANEIAKAIGVSVKKAKDYINSINSIAKMIAEDRSRLDYFSSPGRSSFVDNAEYGGSFDFSTLCKKRRLLTGTFTAIQKALPNTALTADEILDIRNRMKEKGLEVSCGLCYVEGSRANMGQFAKEFLRLYKQYYPDAWQPNMADVNTPDGIEWVRINHPECYEQYEYFWNHYGTLKDGDKNLFASQQKPKLYQLHTEYKGEILNKFKNDDKVEDKNLNGGIRLQSFSDFEIVHLIDTMQIIMDMSRVGLAGQAYTKVPDFAWALGDTGLKINLSLIAKGVDDNGKLIFDDVEGMPIAEAMKLRDRYSKNVGTILVAFNDAQLLAAMADDRVDFIIPFHRSQWKKSQYEAMGLPAKTKDYTFMQNEKFIKPTFHEYRGRMVKDKATNYMPNEYWDFSKSGKENAEAYLEMCARNNKRPKFYKLLANNGDGSYSLKADGSTDGYWKLLIDFKMYDNDGIGSPQMAVKPEFNMEEATRMLNDYSGGHSNFPVAQGVVDSFVKDYKASHKGQKFSERGTKKSERNNAPTFYSLMARVVDGLKQEKFGSSTVVSTLRNKGVKAEEIKWSGIEEFLEGKKSVTKAELQEFIAGSMLQIEEETLDNKARPYTEDQQKRLDEYEAKRAEIVKRLADEWKKITGDEFPVRNPGYDLESTVVNKISDANKEHKDATFEGRLLKKLRNDLKKVSEDNDDFGFDSWNDVLRSIHRHRREFINYYEMSTNDKAIIVKYCNALNAYNELPNKITDADTDRLRTIAREGEQWNREMAKVIREHDKEQEKYKTNWDQYSLKGGKNYREMLFRIPGSTYSNEAMFRHWDERKGVLAHARVQDMDTFIGKMLFIEEIQSDWHNEGHKEGYRQEGAKTDRMLRRESEKAYEEFYAAVEKMVYDNAKWEDDNAVYYVHPVAVAEMFEGNESHFDQYGLTDEQRETIRSMVAEENARQEAMKTAPKDAAAPDAPFKDTYHEYVLKRLLRMAAEEGYDSIGWTTADIQSERWSDDYAEGYRIEYDQDIPKFLKKYGKQWGAEVGKTTLPGAGGSVVYVTDSGNEYHSFNDAVNALVAEANALYAEEGIDRALRMQDVSIESKNDTTVVTDDIGVVLGEITGKPVSTTVWSMDITPAMQKSVLTEGQAMYSERGEGSSNRHLLANAFEGITKSSPEYKLIQQYKGHIEELYELDEKLSKLNAEIRDIRFTKGKYDAKKLKELETEAEETAKEISSQDQKLLWLEASEPLRKLIDRERKKEAKKTKDHVKELIQNKKDRAEQTEYRHKIRKVIRDLDKILNRGNKKQNVKEDMKGFVSKALELADYLFTDHISNDELIRRGIDEDLVAASGKAQLVKETEDIITKLYDEADSLTDEEFARLDDKRKANEAKLKDLLTAQRNRRLDVPVYNLFNDLVTEYASLKNSNQDAVKAAYSEDVERLLRTFLGDENSDRAKALKNMRVADMTTEELWKLYNAYTMVLTTVRDANKFHVQGMNQTIEQVVGRIAGDFSSRKIPEKKLAIAAQKLANKIGWDYEKLYYALDRIGSEAFTELIMNIADSENTVMQDIMEAIAFRDKIVEKYGFNNWAVNKEIDREFMDNSGKKFKLTLGQMMSLYAYSRREGAWDHIEYGGFVFGEAALTNPKPADSYKLSKEQCEAITSLLTKDQKGYVEDMQKFLSETMGEKGNEVSMLLYGIKLFGEKNYFPIHVAGQFKAQAQESQAKQAAGFGSMSNAGFTHAQNPNAKAPFVLEGFNEVWSDHVNEMSRYHGTVPALEDLRRVMNRSTYSDSVAESQSIKQLMENSFGKEAVEYFDNLYREANSGAITDKLQKNSKKLLSLFRKNSVAYSLSVLIQQPASLVRAYALIDKKYFGFKGFGAITSGVAKAVSSKWNPAYANAYNEMVKYAPGVTMAKEIGGFDTATGGSIRSYLLDTKKSIKQKWNTGTALEKGKAVLDVVDDNAIANLPNVADKIAWIEIWNACKRETVATHKDLTPNSEAFMQAVGERFTEVIRATQVYDSIFAKSPMLKSKNLAVQYLVSFMNEPNTVANMVESAVRNATRGNWKQGLRTGAVVIHSIIFTNVLKSIIYAMRDDDEDETYIEKYIESITGGMMDDLNALNYIPLVRDVWSIAQGYDVERADMAIVADAVDALNQVIKNASKDTSDMTEEELIEFDKKVTEANWKLVESLSAFLGIPVKNIRREIMAVIDHAKIASANAGMTTATSAWEAIIESIPFMSGSKSKQDKLYNSIVSGDKDYLDRLKGTYKTEDAYNTAVRKALRENDPRIREAAQARYDGNIEEYKRIFLEIKNEGKFSFDEIMDAVNSEENAIKNKLEPEKVTSSYAASDFVEAVSMGDTGTAAAARDEIIATHVANGKTQAEAEQAFVASVKTSTHDAYSSGLLDEAGAKNMLVEYADMDEEEAVSRVNYWAFCDEHPEYDFTESNVNDYMEFAEPANISLEVYAQFITGTKGLETKYDEWGDVEVSKRDQVLEVIDSLPLTWQQKDALYLAAGYSESKIWDVPW